VRLDEDEPHFVIVTLLISGYLPEELTTSLLPSLPSHFTVFSKFT
jgi:hypothetical protein